MELLFPILCTVIVIIAILLTVKTERKKNRYSPFSEPMLRSPGYSLSRKIDTLNDNVVDNLLLALILPLIASLAYSNLHLGWFGTILFTLIVGIVFIFALKKLVNLFKEIRNYRLGLDGEIYTGQELNYLMREGAWVYHDIPYQYGNIDHVVVSKGGIFCVETKARRKPHKEYKVKFDGEKLAYPDYKTDEPIKQAKRHAEYLYKHLLEKTGFKFPVIPIVALPGWYVEVDKTKRNDVLVITPKRGQFLTKNVKEEQIPGDKLPLANGLIESYARDIESDADLTDPNAHEKYSFLFKRKKNDPKF